MEDKDGLLIEAFLEGRLSQEERQQFEARLEQEPELAAELDLYREVDQRLAATHKEHLLADWKQHLADHLPEEEAKKPRYARLPFLMGIAASVLLLLWLAFGRDRLTEQLPYQEYFAHLPRENANLNEAAADGRKAYDLLDYDQAYASLLQEVAAGGDSLNLIYASVAAIGSERAEKAIPLLGPLVDAPGWELYQAEIQWYLALAYLQEEDPTQAKELLQNVANTSGEYTERAVELLELLDP